MAAALEVRKNVNQVGWGFDTVFYYSLTLCNTGDQVFTEVVLNDTLDSMLSLVPGSVMRDGNVLDQPDLAVGVPLGELAIEEWTVICYAAQITTGSCGGCVSNTAKITGTYSVETGGVNTVVVLSNTTYAKIDMECFRQELLSKTLVLPDTSIAIESIEYMYTTPEIIEVYTIPTYKGISHECQVLSGCKLVVAGMMNVEVVYTALTEVQQVQCANFKIPIFSYVVVPSQLSTVAYDVKILVEKLAYEVANERAIHINLLYCIQASM